MNVDQRVDKSPVFTSATPEELAAAVREFEAANPTAQLGGGCVVLGDEVVVFDTTNDFHPIRGDA